MNILITGAAGYIGSARTEQLIEQGHAVIALDNLKYGYRAAVHPAAESVVEFSMTNPDRFFRTNVAYSLNLLDL